MLADAKSFVVLLCCLLALAGSVFYSVRHPPPDGSAYQRSLVR